jgi:hypothetical protein
MKPSGLVIAVAATAAAFTVHDLLHGWGNVYTRALAAGAAAAAAALVLGGLLGLFSRR